MLNYQSRSKFALMLALVLFACQPDDNNLQVVSPETYASESCWFESNGNFGAFLLLANGHGVTVPYVISTKCSIDHKYGRFDEQVIKNLSAIRLDDGHKLLQRSFHSSEISGNFGSELPLPAVESRLYYLQGRVERHNYPNMIIYSPIQIDRVVDTGVRFGDFIAMTLAARSNLAKRYSHQ